MADDFYLEVGKQRWAEVSAGRAQAVANLEAAKAAFDEDSAKIAVQEIADYDAALANLSSLYNRHIASQTPPPEPSREELMARPMERMSHADMYKVLKGSTKYGLDDAGYMAGIREVAARRARGE
jgi:hypothetical protein